MKQKKTKKKKWKFIGTSWAWKNKKTGDIDWKPYKLGTSKAKAQKNCGTGESLVRIRLEVHEI